MLSRIPLVLLPTPLHRLDRMSEHLGIDLWIKRDDLTGFALGGNKGRKLEYLMAAALLEKAEVVVTCGSLQSNFIRQLGAACSVLGLQCAAAVMDVPYEFGRPSEAGLATKGGNEMLDRVLGIDLRLHPDGTWDELFAHAERLAEEYEAKGMRAHRIPVGGSTPTGAFAFHQAAGELQTQGEPFEWIVFASSSGSTQAGLQHGFHGTATKVLGIAADPEPDLPSHFAEIAAGLDELTGERKGIRASDFRLNLDYVGPGYGIPSAAGQSAIERLARTEGVFLDPIYSAKAFSGLMDLAGKGEVGGRVCFWHTGGTPSLFALP